MSGIKQKDIQKCIGCGEGVAHDNQMVFYTLNIRTQILNLPAMQRQYGLELLMGGRQHGAVLANVMGPDEDMAVETSNHNVWLCIFCASTMSIAAILEKIPEEEDKDPDDGL